MPGLGKPARSLEPPPTERLTRILAEILGEPSHGPGALTILERRANAEANNHPTEIVACRLADGTVRRLFCKHRPLYAGSLGQLDETPVMAEALQSLYLRELLGESSLYRGVRSDRETASACLVYEFVDRAERLDQMPRALKRAARWLGNFHARGEAVAARGGGRPLRALDAAFFLEWARRVERFSHTWPVRVRWLDSVCDRFAEVAPLLCGAPATVIHGQFYPAKILIRSRAVFPLDWEKAALAAGEIDLACLTEGCNAGTLKTCVLAYEKARWPEGAPPGFERTLAAARLHMAFRWLGEQPDAMAHPEGTARLRQLRARAKDLALL
ncbi:MAG TPA: hypothetical protein VGY53_02065 [Isosphaeraceae bacterium]|nr:hypothetical protein [Isosphaeraceae bacterium]